MALPVAVTLTLGQHACLASQIGRESVYEAENWLNSTFTRVVVQLFHSADPLLLQGFTAHNEIGYISNIRINVVVTEQCTYYYHRFLFLEYIKREADTVHLL